MPYIKQIARRRLERTGQPKTAGELNYVFTIACIESQTKSELYQRLILSACGYVDTNNLSYQIINDILGALTGANKEYYRRTGTSWDKVFDDVTDAFYNKIAIAYEEEKIFENGDVYE